jgi:hypothetical protein
MSRSKNRARAAPQPKENFEPPIVAPIELSAEVLAAREEADAQSAQLAQIIDPRIEGHLVTYRTMLDTLIEAHRNIAETMDFDLGGRTRWAAIWDVSGRCLGLCNSLLTQLQGGFASEVVPTLRAIHEADLLLSVLTGPGEEGLLRQWLDDAHYVKEVTARNAAARIEKPLIALMKKEGIELLGDQTELGGQVYDILSKVAHNMRVGFAESVSVELRKFAYGPHPDPRQRAVHVEFSGQIVEEVTLLVGRAFATRFLGRQWYEETIKPLLAALEAVRQEMPVDPETVHGLMVRSWVAPDGSVHPVRPVVL